MEIRKPPARFEPLAHPALFLAGSIEMGSAPDWQERVTDALSDRPGTALNPRRDEWDASWRQRRDEPRFREQVDWELDAQAAADVIAMYFAPQTRAPVTLLELGLFADSGKIIACCPDGYWRKGNVEIVCHRHTIPLVETLDDLIAAAERRLFGPVAS